MFYMQTKKILISSKINNIVQTENQFIPSSPVFQAALKKIAKYIVKLELQIKYQ